MDSFYIVHIMILFSFLLNCEKLLDSINFNVNHHYFIIIHFHKCRKNPIIFYVFVISYSHRFRHRRSVQGERPSSDLLLPNGIRGAFC
jgi:uncharacterized protein YpiB (UPF0302 family)